MRLSGAPETWTRRPRKASRPRPTKAQVAELLEAHPGASHLIVTGAVPEPFLEALVRLVRSRDRTGMTRRDLRARLREAVPGVPVLDVLSE